MSGLGVKSIVYFGDLWLGELETVPVKNHSFKFPNNEIWIHHISPQSERCLPMAVLQTICPDSVVCKLQSVSVLKQPLLISLHSSCFYELKTAVVLLGEKELHLVAMASRQGKYPSFWCCFVPSGAYDACLPMLNARCLWLVLDLDETLVVTNTMKTFRDRIKTLRSRIDRETDPVRKSGMNAEMTRYAEDQELLRQYIETDTVVDDRNVCKAQFEVVPEISESQGSIVRPVIRLPCRRIVLTRIIPEIRDTSVLVRLRPCWEDLRRYLIAKGRKRFEVYVCTMAERDYALEMWRLLDPEAHLIDSKQMLNRVVCVNSRARKSLPDVFQKVQFLPEMAMVIDDRIKVWDDIDVPRVQVVPAFTPYYAPQAEAATGVPVLCVVRNIACNVRVCFFKEFDENLLQRISELFYEDEVENLPSAPDVRNYLMEEEGWSAGHVNRGYNDSQLCGPIQGSKFLGPDSQNSLGHSTITSVSVGSSSHVTEVESKKPCERVDLEKQNLPQTSHLSDTGNRSSLDSRPCKCEENLQSHAVYAEVLRTIGEICNTKVEFRFAVDTRNNSQFCVEALFGGDKVGIGRGETENDARQQAAENALRSLADKYISSVAAHTGLVEPILPKVSSEYERGFFKMNSKFIASFDFGFKRVLRHAFHNYEKGHKEIGLEAKEHKHVFWSSSSCLGRSGSCIFFPNAAHMKTNFRTCGTTCMWWQLTGKEAWDKLKELFEGNERTKRMQVLNLKQEFETLNMKERDTIGEYYDKLMEVVNKTRLMGEDLPDSRVVEKVFVSLPERFEAKLSFLEDSRNINELELS